jgi:three-Cys-motif partner protein
MKKDAKKIVLPHSQAKLDLYKSYLEKYFTILGLAKWVTKINIYDIFCGSGLYDDGNIGSPLIAVECVKTNNTLFEQNGWNKKEITLNIHDGATNKIDKVKNILKDELIENCKINFYNYEANEMLDLTTKEVNAFSSSERTLVFIDPYGYSDINKRKLLNLIQKSHTEILLFLPAMQMYRFSEIAFDDVERKCYEDLRNFISDFMDINQKYESVFEFINAITAGFSFDGNYYSCSHYLERDKGNYYAVFFITSHIYGLERMLEVKWKADPSQGKGYKKNTISNDLFGGELIEYDKKNQLEFLTKLFIDEIKKQNSISNVEVYELAVKNAFLPKHCNAVIKQLSKESKIVTCDKAGSYTDFGGATYIDYTHYKENNNVVYFKLK